MPNTAIITLPDRQYITKRRAESFTPERPIKALKDAPRCEQTKRVALISPVPEKHHELIGYLAAGCCDVLMLHKLDLSLLQSLPLHLLLLDQAASEEEHRLAEGCASVILIEDSASPEANANRIQHKLEAMTFDQNEALSFDNGLIYKDIRIDRKKMSVSQGSRPVLLTKTEYEILLLMLESDGAVRTREEILNLVWGTQFFGGSNVVDVHVKSLRKKLGDRASSPKYIVTVRGTGYKMAE